MVGENTPIYRFVYLHLPELIRGGLYSEYALMAFCFFLAITAAITLDWFRPRRAQWLLWAIALLTPLDLIHVGSGKLMNSYPGSYNRPDSDFGTGERIARSLRTAADRMTPPTRVDYTDGAFWQGMHGAGLLQVFTPSGDNPFALLRPMHVRQLYTTGKPWERNPVVSRVDSPVVNMMNIGVLAGASPIASSELARAGLEVLDKVGPLNVYLNPHALPRFFLPSRVRKSSGESETLRLLGAASFDPAAEAIVEGIPADRDGLARSEVKVIAYTPNRIELNVNSDRPAFLATSEPMYPGWIATLNGAAEPLLMTNGAFRGMFLPAGQSNIVMQYRPTSLAIGAAISMLVALLIAGIAAKRDRARE
jgi:hypothetical protein